MVRIERSRVRAAGDSRQDWGIHFQIAVIFFQNSLNLLDDSGSLVEHFLYFRIHDQIYISLTIADILILQPLPLVWQYLQRLGEQNQTACLDGNLPGLGLEYCTLHADNIANVVGLKELVFVRADRVSGNEALDPALLILQIDKGRFAHLPEGHDPARAGNLLILHRFEIILNILAMRGHVPVFLQIWVSVRFLQRS